MPPPPHERINKQGNAMPKPPPEQRFRIICEVGVADLGPAMVDLAQIKGLTVTGNELVTDVPTFGKKTYEVSGADFLLPWIEEHPTFKAREATAHFEASGREKSATYFALNTLIKRGVLKRLEEGMYSRADVKQIEAPRKTRVAKGPPKKFTRRADDVVLTYARRNHGRINTHKLIDLFEAEGRARNSVYACIDGLMKRKQLKRVGDAGSGQYVLLAKAAKTKPAKQIATADKPAPINGAVVEEMTHG
jgi:hypothetical protein